MEMQMQMRYDLTLSPHEIALRRIAIDLWRKPDILALIAKFPFKCGKHQREWQETVECKVVDELSKLQLPESITRQMIHMLRPVGSQILKWKFFHESFLDDSAEGLGVHILEKLCWTFTGTVDYQRTAVELMRFDVVDIVIRYQLACLYCLDQYIPSFWKELPQESKMYFCKEKDATPIGEPYLWFCWPHILKGQEHKLDYVCKSFGFESTFYQFAFEYSAVRGNGAASQYFLSKLSLEERETSIIQAAKAIVFGGSVEHYKYPDGFPNEKVSDVLCCLLSLMTSEMQMQIFRWNPFGFLKCFLVWPLQELFLDNADVMWTLLLESDYGYIWTMSKSIQNSDFPELFQDFFLRSPDYLRKYFIDVHNQFGVHSSAFFGFDAETIKLILRNVDSADRVRLMTSERAVKRYCDFIWKGRWQMMAVCIRETRLSREDKERLKRAFLEYLKKMGNGCDIPELWNPNFRKFFQFLDETHIIA